jgi:hypothetical protein
MSFRRCRSKTLSQCSSQIGRVLIHSRLLALTSLLNASRSLGRRADTSGFIPATGMKALGSPEPLALAEHETAVADDEVAA